MKKTIINLLYEVNLIELSIDSKKMSHDVFLLSPNFNQLVQIGTLLLLSFLSKLDVKNLSPIQLYSK